jgi:hypothetical protein
MINLRQDWGDEDRGQQPEDSLEDRFRAHRPDLAALQARCAASDHLMTMRGISTFAGKLQHHDLTNDTWTFPICRKKNAPDNSGHQIQEIGTVTVDMRGQVWDVIPADYIRVNWWNEHDTQALDQ